MGVPSFFRWLVDRYPKVLVATEEEHEKEFDNLYLDMNNIVHPCFHPDDELFPPCTADEVFVAIFGYIDHIIQIVRPRNLIYMAVDGVAPRAKMNHQRARRFMTSKHAELAEAEEERLRVEFEKEGKHVLPNKESEVSDSNIITPGTEFMEKLSKALEYYIRLRLNSDPGWKNLKVILSDASIPGEGEHKIMSFIRLQRNLPGYNPNTRHCLYGLDADLIMLALATHEIHFSILREDISFRGNLEVYTACKGIQMNAHDIFKSNLLPSKSSEGYCISKEQFQMQKKKPYQFLNIWTLRECLEIDLRIPDPVVTFDIEKIVDDFVFICFFTGNDFLPHLPSVAIREGAMDLLMTIYKKTFNDMGGYLVDTSRMTDKKMGYIKIKRVKKFMRQLGLYEEKIFYKRNKLWQKYIFRYMHENIGEEGDLDKGTLRHGTSSDVPANHSTSITTRSFTEIFSRQCDINSQKSEVTSECTMIKNTIQLKQCLKDLLAAKNDLFLSGEIQDCKYIKMQYPFLKTSYYQEKFSKTPNDMDSVRNDVVVKYMEGLFWTMQYYYAGVCSWSWYYPYYYAPFASDLAEPPILNIKFDLGHPFSPFNQLMSVLPPKSSHALPRPYRELMLGCDSPLLNFYYTDVTVDTAGKRYMWQGIVKLPFIEVDLLMSATKGLDEKLENGEKLRNVFGNDIIFVRSCHPLGIQISSAKELPEIQYQIDATSCLINGFLCKRENSLDSKCQFISPVRGMEDIDEDHSLSAFFLNPRFHDHVPRLPENVDLPDRTITKGDVVSERMLWHEYEGPKPPKQQRFLESSITYQVRTSSKQDVDLKTFGSGWRGRGNRLAGGSGFGQGYPSSYPNHQSGSLDSSTSCELGSLEGRNAGSYIGQDYRANNSASQVRMSGRSSNVRPVEQRDDGGKKRSSGYRGAYSRRGGW